MFDQPGGPLGALWLHVQNAHARLQRKQHAATIRASCAPDLEMEPGMGPSSARQQVGNQPRKSRIVRMPRPFASITDPAGSGLGTSATGSQSVLKAAKRTTDAGPGQAKDGPQERILISEVEVTGVEGELKAIALAALKTRPNFAYTINEVKQDVARVFGTGWFRACVPDAVDTRDGVKLIIKVTPNDEVRGMVATGANALPNAVVQRAFKGLFGRTLNFVAFKRAVAELDNWYHERGILGQVTDFDVREGVVHLECAEAVVGDIQWTFMDPKTQEPVEKPRTRLEVVSRHLTTQPGRPYNLAQAKRDIASIYATGLFEDVTITPAEAEGSSEAAPKVDLNINLVERKTGGLGAGGGLSSQARSEGALPGFVGSFSYSEKNFRGLNQKLSALVELGQVDKIFKLQHTDPWLLGDKHRTSRTLQLLNNRASGAAIHGRVEPEAPPVLANPLGPAAATPPAATTPLNGLWGAGGASGAAGTGGSDEVVIGRLIGGVEFRRPLSSALSGSLGMCWQRVSCLGPHGDMLKTDCYGAPLTFAGDGVDHSLTVSASATLTDPDDPDTSALLSVEAGLPTPGVPATRDWLRFTRVRGRADTALPLLPALGLTAHARVRGGAVLGDLPPYEAFSIGGTNSVRGYAEGGVGTGRQWLEACGELRFPLGGSSSPLSGVLFVDWGSDLDSGASVIGDPAGVRGKPGSGHGYGGGVRVDTPVGPLRLEYAWNANRMARFHVGVAYD